MNTSERLRDFFEAVYGECTESSASDCTGLFELPEALHNLHRPPYLHFSSMLSLRTCVGAPFLTLVAPLHELGAALETHHFLAPHPTYHPAGRNFTNWCGPSCPARRRQ